MGPSDSGVIAQATVENGLTVKPEASKVTVCPQQIVSLGRLATASGMHNQKSVAEELMQFASLLNSTVNGPLVVWPASVSPVSPVNSTPSLYQATS